MSFSKIFTSSSIKKKIFPDSIQRAKFKIVYFNEKNIETREIPKS